MEEKKYRIDVFSVDDHCQYATDIITTDKSKKDFFRYLQQEYGKCTSKVYQEIKNGTDAIPCGWVFVKRMAHGNRSFYNTVQTYYMREVWVYEIQE